MTPTHWPIATIPRELRPRTYRLPNWARGAIVRHLVAGSLRPSRAVRADTLARRHGLCPVAIRRHLVRLERAGLAERVPRGHGVLWRRAPLSHHAATAA